MTLSENQKIDHVVKAQRLLDLLDRAGVPYRDGPLLDFGCGDGELCLELARLGLDVRGLELSEAGVAAARQRFAGAGLDPERIHGLEIPRENYLTKTPYTLPFASASIQTVVSIQVFEHVSDLDSVLAELARILVPGGVVYAEFPSRLTPVEPHIRIPFAHWLPYSRLRATYIESCYRLGLGLFRDNGGTRQNEYLRTGVFYRSNRDLDRRFRSHFTLRRIGALRITQSLRRRRWPSPPGFLLQALDGLLDNFYERSLLLYRK